MTLQAPLFWHQGLFLQPQHFQLLERSFDARLIPGHQLHTPHFWGVRSLAIKRAALGVRSLGLSQARLLFSDGAYVEYPGNAVIEDRSFTEGWIQDGRPLRAYVGLKKWTPHGENVTVLKSGDPLAGVTTRWVGETDGLEVRDLHAGGPAGHVKALKYVLKLFWETECDNAGDYELIPIAQIERQGSSFTLSERFIPPCVSISGNETLLGLLKEINDQLLARSRELEAHKRQRGIATAEFGSRDMVYLLALRSINRYLPLLRHYSATAEIHPWHVYGILRQIVGDLSCFSEKVSVLGEEEEETLSILPDYDPLTLYSVFSNAQRLIARLLDEITAGPDNAVPLTFADGVFSADLKPDVFDGSRRFYLALTTQQEADTVTEGMKGVAKLGSRARVELLTSHALPGLPVEFVASPPQELPRRKNVLYFSVDTSDRSWEFVEKERALACCWDKAPADLKMELLTVSR